jgi:hypothetical protein
MFGLGQGLHLITDTDKTNGYKEIDVLDNNLGTSFYFDNIYQFENIISHELYIRTPIFPYIESVTSPQFKTLRVQFRLGDTGFPSQQTPPTYRLIYYKYGTPSSSTITISGRSQFIYGLLANHYYSFYIRVDYGPIFNTYNSAPLVGTPVDKHLFDYTDWNNSSYTFQLKVSYSEALGFVNGDQGEDAVKVPSYRTHGWEVFKITIITTTSTHLTVNMLNNHSTPRYLDNDGSNNGPVELIQNNPTDNSRIQWIEKVVESPYTWNNNKKFKMKKSQGEYCRYVDNKFKFDTTDSNLAQVFEMIKTN